MIKKTLNSPLIMTWLDMFVKFGMNIILLPIATIYLAPEELAYYLFIGTLLGIAYLAEGGTNRVVLRATSYFKEGSTVLPNNFEEIQELKSDGKINYKLLGQLVQTSFIIYFMLGIISLVLFFTIGYFTSENLISKQPDIEEAYITFGLLSVFAFLYIMQLRWVGLIQGLGHLARQKRVELVFGLVRIILSIVAIVLGYGVLGVVVAMLLSVVVAHILYKKMFYSYLPKESIQEHQLFSKDILQKLIPSAWKQSVLAWGSYLIYQGTVLLAAQLDDVKLIASYLLTLQVLNLLIRVSNAPAYSYYPNISKAMAKRDTSAFKSLLFRSLKISLGLYILGAIIIYFLGNQILELIGANALLISGSLLVLMLFMYMLELHHVTHATIYTATNHIPFVLPALLSGIAIVVGGWLVIDDYGLWGIVLVQFFVQLSCNNWYPVWLNYKLVKR
jgi:O-antigen/teichoic acid export membrane protein